MHEGNTVTWPGWETVRRIGQGSFGSVYEIQRTIRGRTERSALKVLSIPQNEGETEELRLDGYDEDGITRYFADSLEKIEGEYAMMAEMKGHANVVYCEDIRTIQHDSGFGWDVYIKMELLTPLKNQWSSDWGDDFVIHLGCDICNALKLCEELDIVHRDIKPENIFVTRDGNFKLGDFGIAKTMEGTTGGTKTGTYEYMAPEVYCVLPYHTQADIYSLGLVMYWALNERTGPFLEPGIRPTAAMKAKARARRFTGEPLPPPKNGSEALKVIVLKACAYDPKDRYLSVEELQQDLRALRYRNPSEETLPIAQTREVAAQQEVISIPEDDECTVGLHFVRAEKEEPCVYEKKAVLEEAAAAEIPGDTNDGSHMTQHESKNHAVSAQPAPKTESGRMTPDSVQRALNRLYKEMDDYERQGYSAPKKTNVQAEKESSKLENEQKQKEKSWAELMRMFRDEV